MNENFRISNKISSYIIHSLWFIWEYVRNGLETDLVSKRQRAITWWSSLVTHIFVTRLHWVKSANPENIHGTRLLSSLCQQMSYHQQEQKILHEVGFVSATVSETIAEPVFHLLPHVTFNQSQPVRVDFAYVMFLSSAETVPTRPGAPFTNMV